MSRRFGDVEVTVERPLAMTTTGGSDLEVLLLGLANDAFDDELVPYMRQHGYQVRRFEQPLELVMQVRGGVGCACVLSLRAVDEPVELVQTLRRLTTKPIVILHGADQTELALDLLDLGASDFVCRDIENGKENATALRELRTRLASSLRATGNPADASDVLEIGDLRVQVSANRAWRGEVPIALTAIEHRLLVRLLQDVGAIVPHDTLLRDVWSERQEGRREYLRTYASRLRALLGWEGSSTAGPQLVGRRGVGYGIVLHRDDPASE